MRTARVTFPSKRVPTLALAAAPWVAQITHADAVTEWSERAGEIVGTAALPTPPANRVMALSHTAAFESANTITRRYRFSGEAGTGIGRRIAALATRRMMSDDLP